MTTESDYHSLNLKSLSERITVILVEPLYEGNVGAVARSMKNAGLTDLVLVNFHEYGDEAIARSMSGRTILESARMFDSLKEAIKGYSIVAGTSSTVTTNFKKFRRIPISPEEFWNKTINEDSKIALVFGRENDGLRNHELELCNYFLNIPANPEYPVYNLSHAVGIILYEMIRHIDGLTLESPDKVALPEDLETLIKRIELLLSKASYPAYKELNTLVMLRRLIARTSLTETEFYKIMGIIRHILRAIDPNFEEP